MSAQPTQGELMQKAEELEALATRCQRAEEKLRVIEERFRDLIEGSIQGILIHSDHKPLFVNQKWAAIHGYTAEDILRMDSVVPLIWPKNQTQMVDYKNARMRGGKVPTHYEYQGLRKDGSLVWLENRVTIVQWDGKPSIQTIIVDITERKRAEEELLESGKKYKTLTENSIAGIFIHQDDKYIYVNAKFAEMHGYRPEELVGRNHYDLIHPDQRELIRERAYKRLKGAKVPKQYEIKRFHRDGQAVWHEIVVGDPIHYEGRPAIMGHEIDITQRKQAEEALRESEEKYRLLFEMESDVIILIRRDDGQILEVNNAGTELYGYTRDELLKMKNTDLSAEPEETRRSTVEGQEKIPY